MQTNGDMQIRGVVIHAVGPLVIFLAQWFTLYYYFDVLMAQLLEPAINV